MLFEKKTDFLFPRETNAFLYGTTATFDIPRELPIESMYLRASLKFTQTTAVANGEGMSALIRKVQLAGADGARTRNVIDASGGGLIELSKHWTGFIDPQTASLITSSRTAGTAITPTSATVYNMIVPMHFALPTLEDPLSSAFLLPVDRYNANPQLTVQIGSSAEVFSTLGDAAQVTVGGTPAAAGAGVVLSLVVNRRIVNRLNWPIVDAEISEATKSYTAAGDNQDYEIPITGYYTALLLRCFRTGLLRGDPSCTTLVDYGMSQMNQPWRLELSGNTIRRFRLADVEFENDLSEATGGAQGDILAGSYLLDFLSDRIGGDAGDPNVALGSLLNANIPLNSGARLVLRQNFALATSSVKYLTHRFYANLKDLKL